MGIPAPAVVRRIHRNLTDSRQTIELGERVVFHPTYYSKPASELLENSTPMVTTIVDMIPEILPNLFKKNPHRDKDWYVRNSTALIAISASTARDLQDRYPTLDAPIFVVPLAVSPSEFTPDGPSINTFPRPWALFVGKRNAYKDFDVLLHAAAMAELSELTIVALGGGSRSADERNLIEQLGLERRVHFVSASDTELPAYYRGADLFVFPSRYEGFGLPTLEAMSCGTPVLLPRTSSHPEVAGPAGEYFLASSSESLAVAAAQLLGDRAKRDRMRELGVRRAAEFSWLRTATETMAVYRTADAGRQA